MQQDITAAENPRENPRAVRERDIGSELRRIYDDIAQEPVPKSYLDLLRRIYDEAWILGSGRKAETMAKAQFPVTGIFPVTWAEAAKSITAPFSGLLWVAPVSRDRKQISSRSASGSVVRTLRRAAG